jgi:5-methylcytosine-specific restriction endonuclease McrA
MKRSSLAPVSRKRRVLLRERRKVTDAMKAEGDVLCVRCGGMAQDAHEVVSRARGGSIVDRENIVPLCREDHRWVTEHPLEAEREGLSKRAKKTFAAGDDNDIWSRAYRVK